MEDGQEMDLGVGELASDASHQDLTFFWFPAQDASERGHCEGFDAGDHMLALVAADFF